ncbi:MAG: glycine zipper family protein [Herminiimonas sp.]|nr:glycine zipper family protein [Herminiimonas sp.]
MKPFYKPINLVAVGMLGLAGCTTLPPNGPSMTVLPGSGKTFDQFRIDDSDCRQHAAQQSGGSPANAAVDSGVRSAALGTLLGAVAGAAINGGRGASVGAGTGLLFGSVAGAGAADASAYGLQQRYDSGYIQCMYAKGHKVPVSGRMMTEPGPQGGYPPPPGPVQAPPTQRY